MTLSLYRSLLCLVVIAMGLSAAAATHLRLESKDLADPNDVASVQDMWFEGGKMHAEITSGGDRNAFIMKDNSFYMLNPEDKTYIVMDEASMLKAATAIATMRGQMEEQLKGLPPEQRAMAERMMSQMRGQPAGPSGPASPTSQLTRSGGTDTIAGVSCEMWNVQEGARKTAELCLADIDDVPGGGEIVSGLTQMAKAMRRMAESFGAGAMANQSEWGQFEQLGGVPLLMREIENGKPVSETRAKLLETGTKAGLFTVPADFKRNDMQLGDIR